VISSFTDKVKQVFAVKAVAEEVDTPGTSQTMNLIKPVVVDEEGSGAATALSDGDDSLKVVSGALRVSSEDIDFPTNDTISVYEVKKGDTLPDIAKLFGVSKNTIMWANNLASSKVTQGQVLVILPITCIKHSVKKGDTIDSIAKKYKADSEEIAKYNGITEDTDLAVGDVVLVPEGELDVEAPAPVKKPKTITSKIKSIVHTKILDKYTNNAPDGYYMKPIPGAMRTQGIHGHNGIDLGASVGTTVLAAANGKVIVARSSGYNGGYGEMVIITHDNGTQTVYAHLSEVDVTPGQGVVQGEKIGESGNTGRSTGPHLHFEVRGAINPF
jgi:murein DD-endopeptidase MepM/ murein hydrolase activator NlpD